MTEGMTRGVACGKCHRAHYWHGLSYIPSCGCKAENAIVWMKTVGQGAIVDPWVPA